MTSVIGMPWKEWVSGEIRSPTAFQAGPFVSASACNCSKIRFQVRSGFLPTGSNGSNRSRWPFVRWPRRIGGQLSLRGGKRLRPALVYEVARLVTDEEVPGLDEAALSLELLQMHGLVHDDIIDDSPERRGGPSTYYAYRQEFPHD